MLTRSRRSQAAQKKTYDEWQTTKAAWAKANPDKAKALDAAIAGDMPDLNKLIPEFEKGKKYATRNAGAEVRPIATCI